jgi:hypothetical protein
LSRGSVVTVLLMVLLSSSVGAAETEHLPLYMNWEFWSALAAGIAIVLSQLPPIHTWLRARHRIEVEFLSRISVFDKIGNPNISIYLGITNAGQASVRIKGMQVTIQRDGRQLGAYPGQTYFETAKDKNSVLLIPFTLKPEETWSHTVTFLQFFDRPTEKWYRECEAALRADVQQKMEQRDANAPKTLIEAEPALVRPFAEFFDRTFLWLPGEYVVEFVLATDYSRTALQRKFRFTVFESDTARLRTYATDYKYGAGIYWVADKNIPLFIPITPIEAE